MCGLHAFVNHSLSSIYDQLNCLVVVHANSANVISRMGGTLVWCLHKLKAIFIVIKINVWAQKRFQHACCKQSSIIDIYGSIYVKAGLATWPVLKPAAGFEAGPIYDHITQLARFKTVNVSTLQGAHLHARSTEPT